MATTSVDGLVSGLSTSALIDQLMSLESRGQASLKTRVTAEQKVVAAYQSVNARVLGVGFAARAMTASGALSWVKATSSDTHVTASASAGAAIGTLAFTVTQTARAHQISYADKHALTDVVVPTGSTLRLTVGSGSPVTISTGDGTLSSVVAGLNAAGAGVRAVAVKVADGSYRLQVSATTTGDASTFDLALDGAAFLGGAAVGGTVTGQDAILRIGPDDVRSSTNTFTGITPGLTFSLAADTPVGTKAEVTVAQDSAGLVGRVQSLVDAANAALSEVAKQTAYDAASRSGAPLVGDSTVRQLQQAVLDAVTTALGGSGSARDVGVSVTRVGTVAFDQTVFTNALAADPAKVARLVGRSATYTPSAPGAAPAGSVTLLGATDKTRDGSFGLVVTQAAVKAKWQVDLGALGSGDSVTVTAGGTTATATWDGVSQQSLVDALNAALASKGIGATATLSSGRLAVEANAHGSAADFAVSATGGLAGAETRLATGLDVAGTLDGTALVGSGQVLSVPTGSTSASQGMSLLVSLTAADVTAGYGSGSVSYTRGIAQRLASVSSKAADAVDGDLTRMINGRTATIDNMNAQIAAWDVRLNLRRQSLQRQFTALEIALGKMKDQSSWLAGQIAGLPKMNS